MERFFLEKKELTSVTVCYLFCRGIPLDILMRY